MLATVPMSSAMAPPLLTFSVTVTLGASVLGVKEYRNMVGEVVFHFN